MEPANEPNEQFDASSEGSDPQPANGPGYRGGVPREIKDYLHVDLRHAWEVQLWTREFGCTEDELRRAVKVVGNSARSVRHFLKAHQ